MTSKRLNNPFPLSNVGPQWAGVQVAVTETGFQEADLVQPSYGFNLGTHVGDELVNVQARRDQLQEHIGAPIVWLNQVHGCTVHAVEKMENFGSPEADASFTTGCDTALAIMTADCLPVVFVALNHHGKPIGVAAAHAGWRGLHAGVLQHTANVLAKACDVFVGNLKAWMGPAIGPQSFEVGQDVFDAFTQQSAVSSGCFQPQAETGKFLCDIYGLATLALADAGVRDVQGGGLDTLTDLRWFSHRRGQQQGFQSGRFATLIRLLPGQAV